MGKAKHRARRTAPPPAAATAHRRPAKPLAAAPPPSRRTWICVAAVLVATTVAYWPAFDAEFLSWDDRAYVAENKLLRDAAGLKEIWNPSARTLEQYYPLLFTSYWLEYRLWGDDSRGYHATNVALHLLNVVLVFLLLQRLGASPWVALGAAAVFGLTPVQVASVAWVAERKNTLSGTFYLLAFLLYLRHRRSGGWAAYSACLLAFVGALLSKTQTITLPASVFLADWLLQSEARLRRAEAAAIVGRVAPMLVLGLLAARITIAFEQRDTPSWRLPAPVERPFIIANAPWFYAAKFVVPVNLAPIYPRWEISPVDPRWWLGVIAWPVALAAVVRWRRRIGALALWGMAQFGVTLAPVLGLVPFGYQQYAFVADHFVYLACIGGATTLAIGCDALAGSGHRTPRRIFVGILAVLLVTGYGVATYRETRHWHDTETFWWHVIARNPNAFPAYYSLAHIYRGRGDWEKVLSLFRKAVDIRPDSPGAFNGYTLALRKTHGVEAAIRACDEKLAEAPGFIAAYLERARGYESLGRREEAVSDYDQVLRLAPRGSQTWRVAQQRRHRVQRAAPN